MHTLLHTLQSTIIYIKTCMYTHTYIYIYILNVMTYYIYIYIYYTYIYIYIYIYIYTYVYIRTYNIHTYTYVHTSHIESNKLFIGNLCIRCACLDLQTHHTRHVPTVYMYIKNSYVVLSRDRALV